jgi:6-pyruvoyltetrahydropterin/6-carboxytetrahydropterin synthase
MSPLTQRFHFTANHYLDRAPKGHPCACFHSHEYRVDVVLDNSALFDIEGTFRALDEFAIHLSTHLHNRTLNNQLDFYPSADNLAFYLYSWLDNHLGERLLGVCSTQDRQMLAAYSGAAKQPLNAPTGRASSARVSYTGTSLPAFFLLLPPAP